MIYVDMEKTKMAGDIKDLMIEYTALTNEFHGVLADTFDEATADALFVMMGRVAMNDGEISKDEVFSILEEVLKNEEI